MLSVYPDIEVNRESLIERIHALQVDLSLLASWLASEETPVLTEAALWRLVNVGQDLHRLTPCTRRH